MKRSHWISAAGLAVLALAATPRPSAGGFLTFSGDAALVSALGTTLSTGVTQVAVGQTVNVPFSATVTGVESVSGTVVLADTANGGSIQLNNVVFTVLNSSAATPTFGVSVNQDFAYSGPTTLNALETASGTAHLTGPAVETASITLSPSLKPDNGSTTFSILPFTRSVFATVGPFPQDQAFSPISNQITNIPETAASPVTLTFAYSTTMTPFIAGASPNASNTLTAASFGFTGVPAAVPEPASLALVGLGLAVVGVAARKRIS